MLAAGVPEWLGQQQGVAWAGETVYKHGKTWRLRRKRVHLLDTWVSLRVFHAEVWGTVGVSIIGSNQFSVRRYVSATSKIQRCLLMETI